MDTEFTRALREIIEQSYGGKHSALADAAGLNRSVISKLLSGNPAPSLSRLQALATALNRPDRHQLLMAACRDIIPVDFREELLGEEYSPASKILRAQLPIDISLVIDFLERDALADPQTREFLRRIGRMAGLPIQQPDQLVAEDPIPYQKDPTNTPES